MPKDIDSWLSKWEQAMAKGLERQLYFATNVEVWFENFLTAVYPIKPSWTESYRMNKTTEVNNGTLSYQTLANDFRTAVRALKLDARAPRVRKGSFGPIFAGYSAEEEIDISNSSTKVNLGGK